MKISSQNIYKAVKNIVKFKLFKSYDLEPMIVHFYITNQCNLDCSYCDDGTGNKYADQKIDTLDTKDTKKLLKIIRSKCSWISITGGEPLVRNDIIELLRYMKNDLRFDLIVLNSNGLLLNHKDELVDYVDHIMISLDTLKIKKLSSMINRPKEAAEKIISNINKFSKLQKEKDFSLILNSVVQPDTIEECRQVMNFCFTNNIVYSPMPFVIGKNSHPKLINNQQYQNFIKEIIDHKNKGRKIINTKKSLEKLIDFDRYECLPTLIMDVYCDGSLYYPCSPLNQEAGNLLEIGNWDKTVEQGINKYGKVKKCQYFCPVSCYMEPSMLLAHPLSIIREIKTYG